MLDIASRGDLVSISSKPKVPALVASPVAPQFTTKIPVMLGLLRRDDAATVADLVAAAGPLTGPSKKAKRSSRRSAMA